MAKSRRFLALDPGTFTGWACIDDRKDPTRDRYRSGVWELIYRKGDTDGQRWARLAGNLSRMKPDVIILEGVVRGHLGARAAHLYGGFLAIVDLWAHLHGARVASINLGSVKRHATGKGNAKKPAMLEAALRVWPGVESHDQADALWILDAWIAGFGTDAGKP